MNTGNERAAKELLEYCRAVPALWDRLGGLEYNALESWKQLVAPGNTNRAAFVRERTEAELARRRKALCADGGESPLETLLVNRILAAWMQVMYADTRYSQVMQQGTTFAEAEFHQKRVDRAQRQLLRAIQSLATVRRLLTPLQVNIGQNQINVAK